MVTTMKIYFRFDGSNYEYSLDEFDKEDSFEYKEFDIPYFYSDDEAELLCEKMILELNNGVSFEDTLNNDINKKLELMDSMVSFGSFKVIDSNIKSINVLVSLVNRGCFNDERLIESLNLDVDDLKNKKLTWFDLYLGKKSDNKIKLAPVYLEKNELYFLEDNNGLISVVKKNSFSMCYSDDFDDSYIISTEIYCSLKDKE